MNESTDCERRAVWYRRVGVFPGLSSLMLLDQLCNGPLMFCNDIALCLWEKEVKLSFLTCVQLCESIYLNPNHVFLKPTVTKNWKVENNKLT